MCFNIRPGKCLDRFFSVKTLRRFQQGLDTHLLEYRIPRNIVDTFNGPAAAAAGNMMTDLSDHHQGHLSSSAPQHTSPHSRAGTSRPLIKQLVALSVLVLK